uniref:hypothetical protein n=1 Tax=Dialister hominis TaxID=2582419 RepID=UPI003FEFFF6A
IKAASASKKVIKGNTSPNKKIMNTLLMNPALLPRTAESLAAIGTSGILHLKSWKRSFDPHPAA